MNNHTIFISDLHLSNTTFETTKLFLKFLENITKSTDAVYILGDLFQFWVGDDNHSMFNEQIKDALKEAGNKIPIYLMPGNRDFLLGKSFAKESGCTLISDPYEINLYGKRTLLTHGDLLCTKNTRYRIFRKMLRLPYGIKIFLKTPLSVRIWFANNIQKYSAKINFSKDKSSLRMQIKEDTKNILNKFAADQVIHGHFHIIEDEELFISSKKVRRISLGDWEKQGSILVYHSNHCFEFKTLSC